VGRADDPGLGSRPAAPARSRRPRTISVTPGVGDEPSALRPRAGPGVAPTTVGAVHLVEVATRRRGEVGEQPRWFSAGARVVAGHARLSASYGDALTPPYLS
jgi:hypothetical protein